MIILKTKEQIAKIKAAGAVVKEALQAARSIIRAGIKTIEIENLIQRIFNDHGAISLFKGYCLPNISSSFPFVSCISINDEILHGFPGEREICAGDIVKVDTACKLDGWCADSAITELVSEPAKMITVKTPQGEKEVEDVTKKMLLKVGEEALCLAIDRLHYRKKTRTLQWSQVAAAIQKYVENKGFNVVKEFGGHGIGEQLHSEPRAVVNYCDKESRKQDFWLEDGMVLAIEPIITLGSSQVFSFIEEPWTVRTKDSKSGVHYEHTLALVSDGVEVLT